jgi:hypothetical protein
LRYIEGSMRKKKELLTLSLLPISTWFRKKKASRLDSFSRAHDHFFPPLFSSSLLQFRFIVFLFYYKSDPRVLLFLPSKFIVARSFFLRTRSYKQLLLLAAIIIYYYILFFFFFVSPPLF